MAGRAHLREIANTVFYGTDTEAGPAAHSLPTQAWVGISLLEFPKTHGQGQRSLGHTTKGRGENRKSNSGFTAHIPITNPLPPPVSPSFITFPVFCNFSSPETVQGPVFNRHAFLLKHPK